ncbi:MAG: Arc family DNA-binding protein [Nitrospirae bacterium]|nr:Arc family DNA-binding protein [Nitrospirota bacterium]
MSVLTLRLPSEVEKKIRIKADIEHRSLSEQIKKYVMDGMLSEQFPDLPLSFVKETIQAKKEIESGLGKNYEFGIIR